MITEAILIAAMLDNPVAEDCTWNGIQLHGEVEVVESFADIQVQVVESFPDFTIEFVESFPDIRVQFVESFPGRD